MTQSAIPIREALPSEYQSLGELMTLVYSHLEGFPKPEEQPKYYELLANIGQFAEKPGAQLLVATVDGEVLGGLVYFSDMAQYGSGGAATRERDASGFRLLAVAPRARGMGIGKALVQRCLDLAKARQHRQVILHTTAAMPIAWKMYETLGFQHAPELDFMQGELQVFGFRLPLT